MDSRTPLEIDTETHLFGPGNMAPEIVCVSSKFPSLDAQLMLREPQGVEFLLNALEAAAKGQIVISGHNMAYDMACTLNWAMRRTRYQYDAPALLADAIWTAYDKLGIHCTFVRERLYDIARGLGRRNSYGLDALTKPLGFELDKDTYRLSYGQLDGVPLEQWKEGEKKYALDDAEAGLALWLDQEARVDRDFPDYAAWTDECGRQSAFAFSLHLMGCTGVAVDQAHVKALRESIIPQMAAEREVMVKAGLIDPKKGSKSMKAIRAMIEESWGDEAEIPRTPASVKFPNGQIKTDAETLELCHHPALIASTKFSYWEKMLSGFVDKLAAAGQNRIHARYNPLVDTGRTSCSGPNMQQQYRAGGVRECFIASPGNVLIACDYDCQEVRTFAEVLTVLVGNSRLGERFREDPRYDPHTDFGAELVKEGFGINLSYTEALDLKKAKDPDFKEWRQRAKAGIFGFPGGMGHKKFRIYARSYGLELTEQESKDLKNKYLEFEPYARDYFHIIGQYTQDGDATMKQVYSGRLRGRCHFPAAANTLFQGLGADVTKSALWEVTKKCYGAPGTDGSALFGCRPVIFVHDEIIIEAPEEYAHEAAVELEATMVAAMEELTPHVPSRATPALMRRWTKDADAVFDKDGRYICWEDRPKKEEKAA